MARIVGELSKDYQEDEAPQESGVLAFLKSYNNVNLVRRFFVGGIIGLLIFFFGAIYLGSPYRTIFPALALQLHAETKLAAHLLEHVNGHEAGIEPNQFRSLIVSELDDIPTFEHFASSLYAADGTLLNRKYADEDDEHIGYGSGKLLEWSYLIGRLESPAIRFKSLEEMNGYLLGARDDMPAQEITAVIRRSGVVLATIAPITFEGQPAAYLITSTHKNHVTQIGNAYVGGLISYLLLSVLVLFAFSVNLSNSITSPLNLLAKAVAAGKTYTFDEKEPVKFQVPELSKREDVIGRLSRAVTEMANALYNRIEVNERFAADVAHEVKNPLASMRSAVETLRFAKSADSRNELLEVLELDVQRLDRLVSDISNASRLDAELVATETESFDLVKMLSNIIEFHRQTALDRGVELLWEPPEKPIELDGLEERLAQVFVNLLINAISFCDDGDAIRVWARKRGNRILAVVEDTGPGIPEGSLKSIFQRFYSQRAKSDFGQHSGLGLAISKQIVEAHGGTIWAENIRHADEDEGRKVLGARFVVGLPA